MAFTERYVRSDAAGGGDGTTDANSGGTGAFTFTEAETDMATPRTGYRYNVKAGTYSVAADMTAKTWTAGTASALNVLRGFNSTIGDLDDQGRNADGTLNTTSFPVLPLTGTWTPGNNMLFQNLNISAASLNGIMIGTTFTDYFGFLNCNLTQSSSGSAVQVVVGDNDVFFINCDVTASATSHGDLIDCDSNLVIMDTRITAASTSGNKSLVKVFDLSMCGCTLSGTTNNYGVELANAVRPQQCQIYGNTFYSLAQPIRLPNTTPVGPLIMSGNHVTDCTEWIQNLHSATASITLIEHTTRIRDVTTPRTGVELITSGLVTTDTGDASTDYNDAGAGDFTLIAAAPGAGTGPNGNDIGAWPADAAAGGGGTSMIGPGGGMIGRGY
jgi:hypothetical protein